jgi:alpha/beta superfamily hydrolase
MDGLRLRGDLAVPDRVRGAAVVCHPHPQYGGDRHNIVVEALFQRFVADGFATIRFDFRGVNQSEGSFGGGVDERMDGLAALELVEPYAVGGPLVMAGYSFGSLVALNVVHPAIDAWVAVAPPLGMANGDPASAALPDPKLLIVPEHDQFTPPDVVIERAQGWTNTTIETVASGDHFLMGRTAVVAELAGRFLEELSSTRDG